MTHYSDPSPLDPATYTDETVPHCEEVSSETTDRDADRNSRSTTTVGPHDIPDLPSWIPVDYADFITGSGAAKLADSGVAPLVAAARGYAKIDAKNFAAEMKKMDMKPATTQGKRLKRCIVEADSDAMQMPWYSVADLQSADRRNEKVEPFTYQVRPAKPEDSEHGKPIKYEFKPETGTPLDVHPAIPVDWIDTTPVVMFAEGMLKGDAAMSAYLRSQGIAWDELSFDNSFSAVKRMRKLLAAIPEADRVLIVSIAGINNAHQTPVDWREIDLKNREGWIAFDADLESNPFVHAAAKKLYEQLDEKSKMKTIKFLNPTVTSGDNGSMAKAGVDDYLAKSGDWKMLLRQLTTTMPPAPARSADERPGAFRVSKDGYSVEECVPINNGPGGSLSGYRWDDRVQLGGRILFMEKRRQVTDEELETGVFDRNARTAPEDSRTSIEVTWQSDGVGDSAVIEGPNRILNDPPADWMKISADIPDNLLLNRDWPPRAARGDAWIRAVKGNRPHDQTSKTRWMQMGWVPVENDVPVFIVGNQVIGGELSGAAMAGIDNEALPVADSYGVGTDPLDGSWDDAEYRKQVETDFRAVIDAYITSGAWTDQSAAVIVLATGLRPTVPLRPRTTVFFWGPKGTGKSYSAQACMYFWARRKSSWQDGTLPGSAKDTQAYTENAIAHTPIWVIDDLAPSAVKKQAEAEDAKLSDITRAIFNNATKGRMNADMTSRKVNKPIAQLIITAENELTTPSVKERLIPVFIGKGKLHPDRDKTDRIINMASREGTQARFTSHVIRYIRHVAANYRGGWAGYRKHLDQVRSTVKFSITDVMRDLGASRGSLERVSTLASDLLLSFAVLQEMAIDLGMEEDFVNQFEVDGLCDSVIRLVTDAHAENQQSAPGASLIRALTSLLASGGAHVIAGDDPTRPPIVGNQQGEGLMNDRLGWKPGGADGSLRPVGPTIGTVVTAGGRRVILFDRNTAYSKAAAAYPTLIQHVNGAGAAWASVWDENYASTSVKREKKKNGNFLNTVRPGNGDNRVSGVPVDVETILNPDEV
ncbi:hypothetical protein J2T22_001637 [Pseudarthrobacter defluvii]|uniref:DUF3854 domain-containing protein n=1 Tax=Pseudarthrobacter defluvii TaxID=410837 RepID=A0ABT9UFM6_9MICC|nr:hypothetical protein [Pseudarthrobacter defluvii]MDQ0118459.1 hypothetical protein [Pseudarthrobacter defluvii]